MAEVARSSEEAPILSEGGQTPSQSLGIVACGAIAALSSVAIAGLFIVAITAIGIDVGTALIADAPHNRPVREASSAVGSASRRTVAPVRPPADRAQLLDWYPADSAGTNNRHVSPDRGAKLLGKTLRATVDISQAGCGCVAGFYLYEGGYNPYCDASGNFPGRCGEIDLLEGNRFAWHSTLHNTMDHPGQFGGFGGMQQPDMTFGQGPRDMSGAQYGPGGSVIDTTRPFQTAISFPRGPNGSLADLVVMLHQEGKDQAIEWRVNKARARAGMNCTLTDCKFCFSKPGCIYRDPDLQLFGQMLERGMTMQATWWGTDQPWLDGTLDGEEGGCKINPGQPNTENYGTYKGPYRQCTGIYNVSNWTLEDIDDPQGSWGDVFALMDQQPLVDSTTATVMAQ